MKSRVAPSSLEISEVASHQVIETNDFESLREETIDEV
jgi:hypothetical protein